MIFTIKCGAYFQGTFVKGRVVNTDPDWVNWPTSFTYLLFPFHQGILKGEVSLYRWPPVWLVWYQLYDNWQFLFLFAKQTNPNQTGGRWYSDTSPLSIPWFHDRKSKFAVLHSDINSLKSGLLHLTGEPYCQKSRSAKVKDGIKNLIHKNYLVDWYTGMRVHWSNIFF